MKISIRIDWKLLQELLLDISDDDSVIRPCSGSCDVKVYLSSKKCRVLLNNYLMRCKSFQHATVLETMIVKALPYYILYGERGAVLQGIGKLSYLLSIAAA
ncbi:MAG: hypothetical protein ACSLEL_05095 [Candidatus Malihini olakiniferum]